jgi:hypothetical protein
MYIYIIHEKKINLIKTEWIPKFFDDIVSTG